MRPEYLSNERIYLRPLLKRDAEQATAWFFSPFPVNAAAAESWLKEAHPVAWGEAKTLHLAIVRRNDAKAEDETEEIIGGAQVEHPRGRTGMLRFQAAPWLSFEEADALGADVISIVVPWARDELELMTVTVNIPADQPQTIAAAEAQGMVQGARLREFIARPGHRVDLCKYQALNPRWSVPPEAMIQPAGTSDA